MRVLEMNGRFCIGENLSHSPPFAEAENEGCVVQLLGEGAEQGIYILLGELLNLLKLIDGDNHPLFWALMNSSSCLRL